MSLFKRKPKPEPKPEPLALEDHQIVRPKLTLTIEDATPDQISAVMKWLERE